MHDVPPSPSSQEVDEIWADLSHILEVCSNHGSAMSDNGVPTGLMLKRRWIHRVKERDRLLPFIRISLHLFEEERMCELNAAERTPVQGIGNGMLVHIEMFEVQ